MTQPRTWTGQVFIGVSLDGYIARADGDIGWLTDPPPGRQHSTGTSSRPAQTWETFYPDVDHLVMGRGSYEKVCSFGFWPYEGKQVLVLSSTLTTADDRITVVRSLTEAQEVLARDGARHVYVDGGQVVRSFLRADLIDEITTCWAPVLIGGGLPLFADLDADIVLTLTGSHTEEGMVHSTYRVHRGPAAG